MTAMKSDHYCFATRGDWLPGLVDIEKDLEVRFVEHAIRDVPEIVFMDSLSDWPLLGVSQFGDQALERRFWIVSRSARVSLREIPQRKGGVRYGSNLRECPWAILFAPGGCSPDSNVIIAGCLGGDAQDEVSSRMSSEVSSRLLRSFMKVNDYDVGPDALELLKHGWRLTFNAKAPKRYDLKLPK
jgi:hypothetical protein